MFKIKTTLDEIFQLNDEFKRDPRKEKINGGIGVYLSQHGKPFVLPVIKKVIMGLSFDNFNYLPISGDSKFLEKTTQLVMGRGLYKDVALYTAKQGTIGGTNGIYLWSCFIKEINKHPEIIIGVPTWENHEKILSYFGFIIHRYSHLTDNRSFNFNGLLYLLSQKTHAYVLFHGGPTHNPTGINPSNREWAKLAEIIKRQKHHVVFDCAYLGLGDNISLDSYCVRHFIHKKIPTSVAVSFSKNMTLYQHRTGALLIYTASIRKKEANEKLLQQIFRFTNSNPSAFGEHIVKTILESKDLSSEWEYDLLAMRDDINLRRKKFIGETGGRFDYLKRCRGLFALLSLTKKQVYQIKTKHAIYILSNGRINFGGISPEQIMNVAQAVMNV